VINLEKCVFGVPTIDYLGYRVDATGDSPLPSNVSAILEFPRPGTVKELQGFLGLLNFYRRFLPAVAATLRPLTNSLKRGRKEQSWWSGLLRWRSPSSKPNWLWRTPSSCLIRFLELSSVCQWMPLPHTLALAFISARLAGEGHLGASFFFFKEAGAGSNQPSTGSLCLLLRHPVLSSLPGSSQSLRITNLSPLPSLGFQTIG
jgi:hypothetical protein